MANGVNYEDYIRQRAAALGIDPNTAATVARREGGFGFQQSQVKKNGLQEPSYGPFQLLVGGEGTGFPEGMGNQMMRETGIDPRNPANAHSSIDFALNQAKQKGWGQWYGAKAAGITGMMGIGSNGGPVAAPTPGLSLASAAPASSNLPPLTDRGNIQDHPVAAVQDAVAAPAATPPVDPSSFAGLMKNDKFTGALGKLAGAVTGNSQSKADQEAANITPSGLSASMASADAARAQGAQQMMAQLLAAKRKNQMQMPGLSLMG